MKSNPGVRQPVSEESFRSKIPFVVSLKSGRKSYLYKGKYLKPVDVDFDGFKDIAGLEFGQLTAIRSAGRSGNRTYWLCRCSCGNEHVSSRESLYRKNDPSCGHAETHHNELDLSQSHSLTDYEKAAYRVYESRLRDGRIKLEIPSFCHVWTNYVGANGYGSITVKLSDMRPKCFRVHRLVYAVTKGPIGKGHVVMHTCDNPACCNPDHLIAGTQKDNIQDMLTKGRSYQRKGVSRVEKRKLRCDQVKDILSSKLSYSTLAEKFCVSKTTISNIKRNKGYVE